MIKLLPNYPFYLKILTQNKKNRLKLEGKYSYKLSENALRLFYLLAQFSFSTSEKEVPCFHHKLNVPVAKQDPKRLRRSLEIRKVKESFGTSSEKLSKLSY